MAHSVLLVEPDIDTLGLVASKLRSLGLTVALADGVIDVPARLRNSRADAVLLSDTLDELEEVLRALDAEPDLANVPRLVLTSGTGKVPEGVESLPRDQVELVAKRLYSLQSRPAPVSSFRDDFRGDLQQVSLLDLLQLLAMNRRTGSLNLNTPSGAGEVRLREGEVVDAVYRRHEAEKALFRLLGEKEGSFAFTVGSATTSARIESPTNALLMDGLRQLDEVRRWREELGAEDDVLIAAEQSAPGDGEGEARILEALQAPRTLDELLDELPLLDHDILSTLEPLLKSGRARRIPKGAARARLGQPEQLTVLGAVANRLRAGGFNGPARLILAVSPRRLHTLTHAVRRIAEAIHPPETAPPVPIPHPIATIRIAEGAEVSILGLPTVPAYGPLWPLVVTGSTALVRVDEGHLEALEATCSVAGVPVFDAADLVPGLDEADPVQLATLIRLTLEAVAGE
jgi:hypothetical protein